MFRLAPIFTDHMVLAANQPIRVYGTGENFISVSLNGETVGVQTENGKWIAALPPMPAGGPYELRVTDGVQTAVLQDVFIGLVYLCAGQSNMQLRLEETDFPASKYEDNRLLRFFATERLEDNEPFSPADGWMISTRETAGLRSAIGYLAGSEIIKTQQTAVGIVCCYQGASVIESWVPKDTFQGIGVDLSPDEKAPNHYEPMYSRWNQDGVLYDFAFSQAFPFSVSAVVWYQGESDSSEAEGKVYALELAEMIRIWRRDLLNGNLPFVVVQLADFIDFPRSAGWKLIQQAQLDVAKLTHHVKTVVCADDCENNMIHPTRKQLLSHRIAKALTEEF